jgi:hypothetical protein
MWTRAQLLNFSHAVFTAGLVKGRKIITYKFLFYIGKKLPIFVKRDMSVYSEIVLLRKLPIVSIANFSSFCRYIRQSNPTALRKY